MTHLHGHSGWIFEILIDRGTRHAKTEALEFHGSAPKAENGHLFGTVGRLVILHPIPAVRSWNTNHQLITNSPFYDSLLFVYSRQISQTSQAY